MLTGLIVHTVVFAAVNAFLVLIWLLSGGSTRELELVRDDITRATEFGFWPIWVILTWGTALVIHAGTTIPVLLFGGKARRRRRAMARETVRAVHGPKHPQRDRDRTRRGGRYANQPEPPPRAGPPWAPTVRTGRTATGPERAWVTVMFTDIVGSTQLNEALGDDEWHRELGRHRTMVRSALAGRGGEEVGTQGDGCLSRFPSPADAVLCAIDIQRRIDDERDAGGLVLRVRIGIHAGEAVDDDGDLVGRVVNLASRVTTEAEPGEILVTEPVADYLGARLRFEDRGLRPLKGVTQPRHLLAVLWSDDEATTATVTPVTEAPA